MVIGADEAGKGPVLGPMVAAAVRAPADAIPPGVDDSKRLTADRRADLAAALRADDAVAVGVGVVTPARIDDPETDMNGLTVAAQAEAVGAVAGDDDAVVVDAGDVDADRFGRRVRDALDADVGMRAEHRADERHAHVAAASVVAKVERDARIEALTDAYGDVGSGYPSDDRTRRFLADYVDEHGHLPACARASWATCDDVLAAAEQSSLADF
ncbi:ribonuclease HII [Haloplanus halophilus]|uniref:ribonuclease HII n=1 Tax=Haloplanus halophilus TaxID=2949993 RepID=UPI002040AAB5|nr:ribonuclease HII [Haloplanus sp. GDY1]